MKKIIIIFITTLLALSFLGTLPVKAESNLSRVEDYADLLTDYEEEYLRDFLDQKSRYLDFDIVVVTTNSVGGKSSQAYADDFYDYNGYGMGSNYDGVLLLVNMEYREWYISTTGYGMDAITNSEIDDIGEEVAYYLSYGEYAEAFQVFGDLVQREVERAHDSETVDLGESLGRLAIAIVIGMVLAFIPVTIMKKQLNNVAAKNEASDYVKRETIAITEQRDMYLYRNISRRKRPESSSSSGGHRGSSGRSHGGGGGRF